MKKIIILLISVLLLISQCTSYQNNDDFCSIVIPTCEINKIFSLKNIFIFAKYILFKLMII